MLRQAFQAVNLSIPGAPFYAENPGMTIFRFSFATADVARINEGMARLGLAI